MTAAFSQLPRCTVAPVARRPGISAYFAIGIWLIAIIAGTVYLIGYASKPTTTASPALRDWPVESTLERPPNMPTLLVFLHPKCSCSTATIRQLAKVRSKVSSEVAIIGVFYLPANKPVEWTHTDLWRGCLRLPNLTCVVDPEGQEAARFGVSASGHLMLFDDDGQQRFDGGITNSRGHDGQCFAADSLQTLLVGGETVRNSFPVFGCLIHSATQTRHLDSRITSRE